MTKTTHEAMQSHTFRHDILESGEGQYVGIAMWLLALNWCLYQQRVGLPLLELVQDSEIDTDEINAWVRQVNSEIVRQGVHLDPVPLIEPDIQMNIREWFEHLDQAIKALWINVTTND